MFSRSLVGTALAAFLIAGSLSASSRADAQRRRRIRPEERRQWALHVGGDLGGAGLEQAGYFLGNVTMMFRYEGYRMDLWAPLRFGLNNGFTFRDADWDEPRDFGRIVRCVRIDAGDYTNAPDQYDPTCEPLRWEDHGLHDRFYSSTRLLPLRNVTLGHGSLMYAFRSSLDFERPQVGAQTDLILGDMAEVHAVVDDITRPRVIGAHAFLRPPQLVGENWDTTPDDFVVGLTWVGDIHAPIAARTYGDKPVVDAAGDAVFARSNIHAVGVNAHYMYLWGLGGDGPKAGVFAFADFNQFIGVEDANALHAGARFVYKDDSTGWEFRIGAEYRLLGNRYMPAYFDTDYTVRSQRFVIDPVQAAALGVDPRVTKLAYMLGRPGGYVSGFQAYMQLIIPVPTSGGHSPFALYSFFEEATGLANASFTVGVGPFRLDQFVIGAQYIRRNFNGFEDFASLDNGVIRVVGRWYLGSLDSGQGTFLDGLALDLRYDRRYFQDAQGEFRATDDLAVTLSFSTGT